MRKPEQALVGDFGGGFAVFATDTIEAGEIIDGLHGLLIPDSVQVGIIDEH